VRPARNDRGDAHVPLWSDFIVRRQDWFDVDASVSSLLIARLSTRAIARYEIAPEWDVCIASIMRPAAQERIQTLLERGFHQPGDVEDRLGYHVGQLGR